MADYEVHNTHCCPTHGCKYMDDICPVEFGLAPGIQCELCYEDENETATIEIDDVIITYNCSEATKQAVFDRVLHFFLQNQAFSGESICQSDSCIIDAPETLCDIADIMKFDVEWKFK